MLIYTSYDLAVQEAHTRLWGAAFVLLIGILLANILRGCCWRSRAKMGGA